MPMTKDTIEQIPLFEIMEAKEKKIPAETAKKSAPAKKNEAAVEKKKAKKSVAKDPVPATGGRKRKEDNLKKAAINSPLSGKVPEGDVRLTANIREDLHLKLKIAAARRRTTIGELLEEMVEKYI